LTSFNSKLEEETQEGRSDTSPLGIFDAYRPYQYDDKGLTGSHTKVEGQRGRSTGLRVVALILTVCVAERGEQVARMQRGTHFLATRERIDSRAEAFEG
jgi:hypothetical protein